MSEHRQQRRVLESISAILVGLSVVAIFLFGAAYFVLQYFLIGDDQIVVRGFLQAIITNVIPIWLVAVASYLLLQPIINARLSQQNIDLADDLSQKINPRLNSIDEICRNMSTELDAKFRTTANDLTNISAQIDSQRVLVESIGRSVSTEVAPVVQGVSHLQQSLQDLKHGQVLASSQQNSETITRSIDRAVNAGEQTKTALTEIGAIASQLEELRSGLENLRSTLETEGYRGPTDAAVIIPSKDNIDDAYQGQSVNVQVRDIQINNPGLPAALELSGATVPISLYRELLGEFTDMKADLNARRDVLQKPAIEPRLERLLFWVSDDSWNSQAYGKESRQIRQVVLNSKKGLSFESLWGGSKQELLSMLQEQRPEALHIAGRGSRGVLYTDTNETIQQDEFRHFLSLIPDLKLVFINFPIGTNFSQCIASQACQVISPIWMVSSAGAIKFAEGFYSLWTSGVDIEKAFTLASTSSSVNRYALFSAKGIVTFQSEVPHEHQFLLDALNKMSEDELHNLAKILNWELEAGRYQNSRSYAEALIVASNSKRPEEIAWEIQQIKPDWRL
jgi:hypothetical protein